MAMAMAMKAMKVTLTAYGYDAYNNAYDYGHDNGWMPGCGVLIINIIKLRLYVHSPVFKCQNLNALVCLFRK